MFVHLTSMLKPSRATWLISSTAQERMTKKAIADYWIKVRTGRRVSRSWAKGRKKENPQLDLPEKYKGMQQARGHTIQNNNELTMKGRRGRKKLKLDNFTYLKWHHNAKLVLKQTVITDVNPAFHKNFTLHRGNFASVVFSTLHMDAADLAIILLSCDYQLHGKNDVNNLLTHASSRTLKWTFIPNCFVLS